MAKKREDEAVEDFHEVDEGSRVGLLKISRSASHSELLALQKLLREQAARKKRARELYEDFCARLNEEGIEWHDVLIERLNDAPGEFVLAEVRDEDETVVRVPTGSPVFVDPKNSRRTYAGRGQSPDWLRYYLDKQHHMLEFREDKPLRGLIWRNPDDPKAPVYRGEGPMPKWLVDRITDNVRHRKNREYILEIADKDRS